MMLDRAMFAPIWATATMNGYSQRVAEPAINLITGDAWSAPYEEMRLKGR
jgi:peptide/nickel transport system substrate-binding protein